MGTFSDRQRSHFLVRHFYGDDDDTPLEGEICVVVLQFPYVFRKFRLVAVFYLVWLLYPVLNSPSEAP